MTKPQPHYQLVIETSNNLIVIDVTELNIDTWPDKTTIKQTILNGDLGAALKALYKFDSIENVSIITDEDEIIEL